MMAPKPVPCPQADQPYLVLPGNPSVSAQLRSRSNALPGQATFTHLYYAEGGWPGDAN